MAKKIGYRVITGLLLVAGAGELNAADTPDHQGGPDEAFIVAAAQGGLDEIELSRLATRSAASADVRSFAERMVKEHTDNSAALAAIAKRENVALPVAADSEHMQLRDKLAPLRGSEFDKLYIDTMRTDHQKMVDLLSSASTVKSAELIGYIRKTLPVVQHHLQMAQDLKPSGS